MPYIPDPTQRESLRTKQRPRSSSAAATWTSGCESTPPVMCRAVAVIVICSFLWGGTPHRRNDGQHCDGRLWQAPMRSRRPTGWCRASVGAGPTYRVHDSPIDAAGFDGGRAWLEHAPTSWQSQSATTDRQRLPEFSLPVSGIWDLIAKRPRPKPGPLRDIGEPLCWVGERAVLLHRHPLSGN